MKPGECLKKHLLNKAWDYLGVLLVWDEADDELLIEGWVPNRAWGLIEDEVWGHAFEHFWEEVENVETP